MNKVLVVLNGPMCAGKSTVAESLMKRDGFFKESYDRLKWSISNFSADNPEHRRMARDISFSSLSEALHQGLSSVVDGGHHEYRERYEALAKEYGCRLVSVNIEAPYEVLEQRFLERVAAGKKVDRPRISVTSIAGFRSRYDWYMSVNKDHEAMLTLDSSVLHVDEIVAKIDELRA